jgi:hypothetical protein
MKIKILNINNVLPDITGTSQKGFAYTVKHWNCNVEINGKQAQNIEVKTMDKNLVLELKEYEVEEKNYNGILSYQIVKQSTWKRGGYNKPSYTKQEYNDLFKMALTKLKINLDEISEDNRIKLCISYLIGAKDAGVKADHEKVNKKDNNQASDLQKPEFQQNPAKSFLEGKNPEEDLSVDWDEDDSQIPF